MYIVQLNKNLKAFIDEEDYQLVRKFHWFVDSRGYAVTSIYSKHTKKMKQIKMHRLIMNDPKYKIIDHIDRDKLNNQKSNLRFASQLQNVLNTGLPKNNKSGVKGVSWENLRKTWRAQITINGNQINLGRFKDFDLAIETRKVAEKNYHNI